jgi:carbonic anhydrase
MVHCFTLAIAVLSAAVPASAALGEYSYDPDHPLGPASWADVELEGNQCGGNEQSPIAIESIDCTEYADYKLTVRILFRYYVSILGITASE